MKRLLTIVLTLALLAGMLVTAAGAADTSLQTASKSAASFTVSQLAHPGMGDDWAVTAMVRGGFSQPDHWTDSYYRALASSLQQTGGKLSNRVTEYARVSLGLTAIGKNPANVAGYNLLAPLSDFDAATQPGVTAAAYALLALDAKNYDIPKAADGKTQAMREMYVDFILGQQLSDGGWAIGSEEADPDVTAMALQALAPYQSNTAVKNAVSLAVARLSKMQDDDGGFTAWGASSAESCAQVILALCALDIKLTDTRFVKDGNSVLDKLLSFQLRDGSFCHTDSYDAYATVQSLCALAAATRQSAGQSSFFDMSGVKPSLHTPQSGVNAHTASLTAVSFADTAQHANQQAIETLAGYGIINGMSKTSFAPNESMTRAQFAKIVVSGLGLDAEYRGTFLDVPATAWYAPFVDTAAAFGIVTGVGDGKFNPDGTITVQEAAAMIARAAALCGLDTAVSVPAAVLSGYRDSAQADTWAKSALAYCAASGLWASGSDTLSPKRPILRCEIAQILYDLLLSAELLQ